MEDAQELALQLSDARTFQAEGILGNKAHSWHIQEKEDILVKAECAKGRVVVDEVRERTGSQIILDLAADIEVMIFHLSKKMSHHRVAQLRF